MWLISMAWKNIWRNRSRSLVTMAAIFFAVVLSVITSSLQDGIFDNLVKNIVSFYTGYIQVHKTGYWEEQTLDNSFREDSLTYRKITQQGIIKEITPRLESFALASSENITKGCMVTGIDPEGEDLITQLKSKLIDGNYLARNENAVLLAQGLAGRLQLNTGDTVILIGQGYHGASAAGKYRVKGILHFGSPDLNDKVIFMPLNTARALYSADSMLTSWVLSLHNADDLLPAAASVQAAIGNDLHAMTWEEMLPDIKQHISTGTNNMKVVQGILYLLIGFGIFGTLLMMMVERKFEMGMLVAIGMKKFKLIGLLLVESIFTVLCGCITGIALSIPLVYRFNRHPIRISGETAKVYERFGFEPVFPTSTDIHHFINQGLIVLLIGLLLSGYPIYKVLRLNTVLAMKR